MYYRVIETRVEERDGKLYQVKEIEPITDSKTLFFITNRTN